MKQSILQVFDPPMCCTSGVCGPNVNPDLVRFSADLDWLKQRGIAVERCNLSSHPAAFAQNEVVRDALKKEGNDCLPLIVVNGAIVSRGVYPARDRLEALAGLGAEAGPGKAETDTPAAGPAEPAPACGPGCCCGAPPKKGNAKAIISLIVLLAAAGIIVYKVSNPKDAATAGIVGKDRATFAIARTAPDGASNATPTASPAVAAIAPAPKPAMVDQKIGEFLNSLGALNTVAANQDAVFVYIPAAKNVLADARTGAAVLEAQQTLKTNRVTLGLYTLTPDSADYPKISTQVQPPAILIACKGKGMAAVSGDMSVEKLLQAFTASARGGGCGPAGSGCGPAGSGCGPAGCN